MKNSFFKNKAILVLAAVALTMSACAKKSTSAVRVAGRSNVSASDIQNGNCSTSSAGKVYDSANPTSFEARVKAFVSATMDSNLLGSIEGAIDAKTGIDLFPTFKFDSSGNVDLAGSNFTMKIFDSYAKTYYQGTYIEPYTIQFFQASSGSINRAARTFTITFKDEFGDITFTGNYGSQVVSGTVSFNNYTSATGGQTARGTLGQFSIHSCSLIGQ